jgi:hypothetical protein
MHIDGRSYNVRFQSSTADPLTSLSSLLSFSFSFTRTHRRPTRTGRAAPAVAAPASRCQLRRCRPPPRLRHPLPFLLLHSPLSLAATPLSPALATSATLLLHRLLSAATGRLRRRRGGVFAHLGVIYNLPLFDLIFVVPHCRPQPGTLAVAGQFSRRRLTPAPPQVG